MKPATLAALIVTMLFWGSSFVATKILLGALPSWAFMFLRFSAASVLFIVFLVGKGQHKIPRKTIPGLVLMSLFEPGLYFLFETLGLERTSAGSASIIIAAIPAVVAALAAIFLGEKLNRREWVGVLLSFVGIVIITLFDTSGNSGSSAMQGNLFVLLAVFSAAGYILLSRKLSVSLSPLQITSYQVIFASVFFLPGILIQGRQLAEVTFTPELLGAFGFVVICATFTAFLAYNFALSRTTAPKAAIFINGIPVVTVAVAWIVLGETLNLVQISGGALAVFGLMLANRKETAKITIES